MWCLTATLASVPLAKLLLHRPTRQALEMYPEVSLDTHIDDMAQQSIGDRASLASVASV